MLERFSTTIDKIYAAASGACRWEEALVAIEDLTGSAGAVIDLVPKSEAVARKTLAGSFTEENCSEYSGNYQAICPRIRYAVSHPGASTHYDYLFMSEASMDRDPVYEWFGKHGLRYYLASSVADTPNYLVYVSLQRTRRQGHAGLKDVALFDLVKPHLARAASVADQLGTLQSYQRFSSAMLEALPQAVFALDRSGYLLFANSAGRRLFRADDGLRVEAGHLRAALAVEQQRLEGMVHNAGSPSFAHGGCWTQVSRPSGRLPLAVFVAPLRIDDDELLAADAKVLVIVHDPAAYRCANVDMLTGIYGLTDAEARIASALSGGHSLESASALFGIQRATARSHLKSVFRKLGVSRQQDLVRVLTSLCTIAPAEQDLHASR